MPIELGRQIKLPRDASAPEEAARLGQIMPPPPADGLVYGGVNPTTGQPFWYKLDDVAQRAVFMIREPVDFTESGGVITIDQDDFENNDVFTVEWDGAQVFFEKESAVRVLNQLGNNMVAYRFEFDDSAHTITVTGRSISVLSVADLFMPVIEPNGDLIFRFAAPMIQLFNVERDADSNVYFVPLRSDIQNPFYAIDGALYYRKGVVA
jgi:hypothetical protein